MVSGNKMDGTRDPFEIEPEQNEPDQIRTDRNS